MSARDPKPLTGAAYMLAGAAVFGLIALSAGKALEGVNPWVMTFWRSVFGVLFFLPWILRAGRSGLAANRHGLLAVRGFFGSVVQIGTYVSLALLPMADAVSLSFTAPVFGVVLAVAFLGEKLRLNRLLGIAVGFAGVLIILRPGFAEIGWAVAAPLITAFAIAVSGTQVRLLARTETPERIVFYMMLYLVPFTFVPALMFWEWPRIQDLPWLVGLALCANVFQYCFTKAFQAAEATFVQPFDFARLPAVALTAYMLLGQIPATWTLIGAAVIFIAGILILRGEKRGK